MEKANEKQGPSSIQKEKVKDPFWLEEEVCIFSLFSQRGGQEEFSREVMMEKVNERQRSSSIEKEEMKDRWEEVEEVQYKHTYSHTHVHTHTHTLTLLY